MLKLFLIFLIPLSCAAVDFKSEAGQQTNKLKKVLMSQVKSKMSEGGAMNAIEFCHKNALGLTEEAVQQGYEIGRTSLK